MLLIDVMGATLAKDFLLGFPLFVELVFKGTVTMNGFKIVGNLTKKVTQRVTLCAGHVKASGAGVSNSFGWRRRRSRRDSDRGKGSRRGEERDSEEGLHSDYEKRIDGI